MSLFSLLFGRRPDGGPRPAPQNVIDAPPEGVVWHEVKPRRQTEVTAHLAARDGEIATAHGRLRYRAGAHYIVTPKTGGVSVVRRDIFERTYQRRWLGGYVKRPNVVYRYFTLPYAVTVQTEEGPQRAEPGDWIIQGVAGELWPVKAAEAEQKYQPMPEPSKSEPEAAKAPAEEHAD